MSPFSFTPQAHPPGWLAGLAQTFSGLAGDVVLVIDESGVVMEAAPGAVAQDEGWIHGWEGKAWIDAVATDSRAKVTLMLGELAAQGQARRREINYQADDGHCLTLACSALRLGEHGPSLVVGRDLSATAALQQRLLEAQQQMEAGYWDARQQMAKRDAD